MPRQIECVILKEKKKEEKWKMKTADLRELMKEYIREKEEVVSGEMKKWLLHQADEMGQDFTAITYSNALTSLIKKGDLISTNEKGQYKVKASEEPQEPQEGPQEEKQEELQEKLQEEPQKDIEEELLQVQTVNNSPEPKEGKETFEEIENMRHNVQICLDSTYEEIKKLMDSVKPSTYARNIRSYKEIIQVLNSLQQASSLMQTGQKNTDMEK